MGEKLGLWLLDVQMLAILFQRKHSKQVLLFMHPLQFLSTLRNFALLKSFGNILAPSATSLKMAVSSNEASEIAEMMCAVGPLPVSSYEPCRFALSCGIALVLTYGFAESCHMGLSFFKVTCITVCCVMTWICLGSLQE